MSVVAHTHSTSVGCVTHTHSTSVGCVRPGLVRWEFFFHLAVVKIPVCVLFVEIDPDGVFDLVVALFTCLAPNTMGEGINRLPDSYCGMWVRTFA